MYQAVAGYHGNSVYSWKIGWFTLNQCNQCGVGKNPLRSNEARIWLSLCNSSKNVWLQSCLSLCHEGTILPIYSWALHWLRLDMIFFHAQTKKYVQYSLQSALNTQVFTNASQTCKQNKSWSGLSQIWLSLGSMGDASETCIACDTKAL